MKAESVHFVLFGQVEVPDLPSLFKQIFAAPATHIQQMPGGAGATAAANLGKNVATLVIQPGRIELIVSPEPVAASLPTIELDDGMNLLAIKAPELIGKFPVQRLAIVANVYDRYLSQEDVVGAFVRETKIKIPNNAVDMSFALNCRTMFGPTSINRVLRWDGSQRQFMQMSSHNPFPITHFFFGLARQADINSVPTSQMLGQAEAEALFHALVGEVGQCLSGGYDYLIKQN